VARQVKTLFEQQRQWPFNFVGQYLGSGTSVFARYLAKEAG
jgi:hypothetical protein